ncbi:MAG: hypothetical protein AAB820_02700 [Patescibacteria group bacterium]
MKSAASPSVGPPSDCLAETIEKDKAGSLLKIKLAVRATALKTIGKIYEIFLNAILIFI